MDMPHMRPDRVRAAPQYPLHDARRASDRAYLEQADLAVRAFQTFQLHGLAPPPPNRNLHVDGYRIVFKSTPHLRLLDPLNGRPQVRMWSHHST